MYIKSALISVGLALILVQVSSCLILEDFVSAQEMLKREGHSRVLPMAGKDPSPNNDYEAEREALAQRRMNLLKSINDDNRSFATITIGNPVKVIKMLNKLMKEISWGMFQELYEKSSDVEKKELSLLRSELGY